MSERVDAILKQPEPELVGKLNDLTRAAVDLVSDRKDASTQIAEINRLTGKDYTDRDFFEMWGWTNEKDFALTAASKRSDPIHDLTRNELKEIFGYFHRAEEPQGTILIGFLTRTFGEAFSTDLIYWPEREMDDDELIDEIYSRARRVAPPR